MTHGRLWVSSNQPKVKQLGKLPLEINLGDFVGVLIEKEDFQCNCNNRWKCFSSYFLPIYTAAQWTAIFLAKTNHTSTLSSFVLRLNLKKYLSWKLVLFVLSYSIVDCDLCKLWLFCHFVYEAMQTWTEHYIYTWFPSFYRYLAYIIVVLVVHPPLLSKQGRLYKGGQNFRWKLSLI